MNNVPIRDSSGATLSEVLVIGKSPAKTSPIPNPLHQYASYTYNCSLWWLDNIDFNGMMQTRSPDGALAYPLRNSYVVAEQGGMFANQRLPSTAGLNYYVQDVEFKTVIGLNGAGKSSNVVEGSMTIIEPYGISLIDSLIAASYNPKTKKYESYTLRPFMLQIDFQGWDDQGKEIPAASGLFFRKRFPIRLTEFKINLSTKGTEYRIKFAPIGHEVQDQNIGTTPANFNIKGDTVGTVLQDLQDQWNDFLIKQKNKGIQYADQLVFEIDKNIKDSSILNKKTELSDMGGSTTDIKLDVAKRNFTIPQGSRMVDIITKIMAQSQFLQAQLLGKGATDQAKVLNAFKVSSMVTLEGATAKGSSQAGVHDTVTQSFPKKYTVTITPFASWNSTSPRSPNQLNDAWPYVSKRYNYMYTGANIDILEMKINFDTTYFTSVMAYVDSYASSKPTASTGVENLLTNSPSVLFTQGFVAEQVGLNGFANPTPIQTRLRTGDQNITIGAGGIKSPEAQITLDWLHSIYTDTATGDMVKPVVKIVGDPTLLKQDDWLYVPDPNSNSDYLNWDKVSQLDYANKYGHVRMDVSDLVVELVINSPLDIDTDITNNGLVYPEPYTRPSAFSGLYRIENIKNEFRNGKFEQTITFFKYTSPAMTTAYKNQVQQFLTNSTNAGSNNR